MVLHDTSLFSEQMSSRSITQINAKQIQYDEKCHGHITDSLSFFAVISGAAHIISIREYLFLKPTRIMFLTGAPDLFVCRLRAYSTIVNISAHFVIRWIQAQTSLFLYGIRYREICDHGFELLCSGSLFC